MLQQDVVAVILCGGQGTRLYPLTQTRAKPAVPLAGKYRLVDIPISNCIHSGMTHMYIVTQFMSFSLHRHIQQTYQFDVFSDSFVEILAAEQTLTGIDWYQGTADAVRRQLHRILDQKPRDVLILAGDHLYRMDYGRFLGYHREQRADITLAVLPVTTADASRYGILKINTEGRVVAFREKPRGEAALESMESLYGQRRSYLASMGIYIFAADALAELLKEGNGDDFGQHIIPAAINSSRVYAYPHEGYWEDIGTIAAFYEANLALARPDPPFDFCDPRRPIYTIPRLLPPSRISGGRLEHVVVADGCCVDRADIEESVLGVCSIVRPGVRLRQVVMMGADSYETEDDQAKNLHLGRPHVGIGEDSSIERAIVDVNARIGRGVMICSHEGQLDYDGEQYCVRDGIVVIPENAVIPDGTVISPETCRHRQIELREREESRVMF